MLRILGLSAFYHDSAAALVEDGRIIAAAEEERFTRRKHDSGFPHRAIEYCLAAAGCTLDAVDAVVFYEKPFLKFERLLETYTAFAPRGFASFVKAMPIWIGDKLFQKDMLRRHLNDICADFDWRKRLLFSQHHLSHAASAFFPSPFQEAAVLTMDGVGEWATTSMALGSGNRLEIQREIQFPHSLGLLYSAFTSYLGFQVNSGEYKVMGLAPYGEPKYAELILANLIDVKPDGSFWLDLSYFGYCTGLRMTNEKFHTLFGQPARRTNQAPITQFHMDVAASIQRVTEMIFLRMASAIRRETGARALCLAGGVALNCVANGKLLRAGVFDDLWIQPAAGDAGGALGAAMAGYHLHLGGARYADPTDDSMQGAYLGPEYRQADIEMRLAAAGAEFTVLDDEMLLVAAAAALAEGEIVGWVQGRMEFGPRALGNRSILADPRSPRMQKILNAKVKHRESFRPFAPSVRAEDADHWFELSTASPYMLLAAPVRQAHRIERSPSEAEGLAKLDLSWSSIPAVTHVDYSARIHTVRADVNARYYALLQHFEAITGIGILLNTSFNLAEEPIVCSPEDAFRCFTATEIDVLVVGNCVLRKKAARGPTTQAC
jgi:carbamoyltransferase